MRLQNENTVTIPFITDIHYATDTFIQDDLGKLWAYRQSCEKRC